MITATTAKNLGLIPVGSQHISHAGGSSIANTYIADFYLPNFVRIIGVLVCEWPGIPDDVGAIIGMDIISRGDFSITNAGGQTCMTYRIPSIKAIDYVEEYYKAKYAGTSAYAPCPCGAKDPNGKPIKFIDCHGKPDQ